MFISPLLFNEEESLFVNAQETEAPCSIRHLNMELRNFNHSIYIAAAFEYNNLQAVDELCQAQVKLGLAKLAVNINKLRAYLIQV